MQVITPDLILGKKVLLRFDIDVPIENGQIVDDFRLKAGLPTLKLCLENASQVILLGHIGRPSGENPKLSVAPIYKWLMENNDLYSHLTSGKLKLLENLRFEEGESFDSTQDLRDENVNFAHELAKLGDYYINEAFATYHPAASTTILPTLLPHSAGLNFAKEVEVLTKVRNNPGKPLVAILGGAKVEDKLPVIKAMSGVADYILVGGKLVSEIRSQNIKLPENVQIADLNEDGFDITPESIGRWQEHILKAKTIVWNGPLGKVEDEKNDQSRKIAQLILQSGAESIIGGGDTISAINKWGMLDKFSFVSTGGGAMLKLLTDGTLPTIEVLK